MTTMVGSRRRGRELALQALYQMDVTGGDPHVPAAELVHGVLETRTRIDALIAESAEHWRLDRLSQIDRNILRIGAYELLCRRDVPPSVAIDEAIEIAKRFGNDESAVFVNGVLDQIATAVGAKAGRDAP